LLPASVNIHLPDLLCAVNHLRLPRWWRDDTDSRAGRLYGSADIPFSVHLGL